MSAALLFSQHEQTAGLVPQTGSEAFAAAARAGPDVASVLGNPILAGSYQAHTHAHTHGRREQQQKQALAAVSQTCGEAPAPPAAVPIQQEP